MTARYAIYAAPAPGTALSAFAEAWLGRDAMRGSLLPQPKVPGLSTERLLALTAEPRLYGFHATLKPPFRLADGCQVDDLETAVADHARRHAPICLPFLKLDRLGSFFALVPENRSDAARALAAGCVMAFDAFRAPAPPGETARRRAAGLTPAQEENLQRWGYPYVLEEFRLHYTLTGPVRDEDEADLLQRYLAAATIGPGTGVLIDALWLFAQAAPGAPFRIKQRYALSG